MTKRKASKTNKTNKTNETNKVEKVEMVTIDYERVKVVSTVVRLKDVLLAHSHWHSVEKPTRLEADPTAMSFNFGLIEATWDFFAASRTLEIQLKFRLAAFAKVDGSDDRNTVPLFQLECDWDVAFEIPESFEPSDVGALADFAVANGQLNAFPYVRQYVQDVTGRAGWPPLVLPTFRIPKKRPKALGGHRSSKVEKHE